MKAIICPQCGALIKRISLKDKYADCDYCEAKILIEDNRDKIVEISDKRKNAESELSPWEQYRENRRKVEERTKQIYVPLDEATEISATGSRLLGLMIIGVIALIVIGGFFGILSSFKSYPAEKTEKPITRTIYSPTVNFPTPKPVPQIKYEVKMQWSGDNDMEHYEQPQIDTSKLPTDDTNELKKTVFKNRGVQVKVTIDIDGEVTSAEGVSGHPLLIEAAVSAAKKSLFNSRQKQTVRVLTYYFRLKDE